MGGDKIIEYVGSEFYKLTDSGMLHPSSPGTILTSFAFSINDFGF